MKTLIVYRSVLGTTKKYAQWLALSLHADIVDFHHLNVKTIDKYDVIIVTSGTYAGKMPLVGMLKKNWEKLESKKVIVMAVGIAPEDDEYSIKSYEMIPAEIRSKIKYFKLPGNMFGLKPAGSPSKEKLEPVINYIQGLH